MTDRLTVAWPDQAAFAGRRGRPIRILAVSDEPDPSLDSEATRERIGRIDLIIGAGDLQPEYLSFVTDAFHAPLLYVRGNHDVGALYDPEGFSSGAEKAIFWTRQQLENPTGDDRDMEMIVLDVEKMYGVRRS